MSKAKAALIWIVDILDKHGIPYQVAGGLAAVIVTDTFQSILMIIVSSLYGITANFF